jgi:glucose-1-phosphate cytidylyltransferase
MELYAAQGFTEFVLAAGYRADLIVEFAGTLPREWDVEVVDTGEDTNTGGRIAACRDRLGERFFANYADGLGNVNLASLRAFHEHHGSAASLTAVPLPSQYGTMDLDGDGLVMRFREKPRLPDHRINAGYFVFDSRAFDMWDGEDLERDVLPGLAARGELRAFPHDGFWKSMDTYKDSLELAALCEDGSAPWRR